jgi:hypothetical protein
MTNPTQTQNTPDTEHDPEATTINPSHDELFEAWNHWCKTRRYFAPPASSGHLLGKLSGKTRPSRNPPNARCSSNLAALHLAIIGQPMEALDTRVFWVHYSLRIAPIKTAADALGISRPHYYRLLRAITQRIIASARQIEADTLASNQHLPHHNPNPRQCCGHPNTCETPCFHTRP